MDIPSWLLTYDGVNALEIFKTLIALGDRYDEVLLRKSDVLDIAALKGHIDVVRYLIEEKKFDVNRVSHFGETALHKAAKSGHLDIVKLLVEKGADYDVGNTDGNTVLHAAAGSGDVAVLSYLIYDLKLDVNIENDDGHSALDIAATDGHLEAVKFLIEKGADFRVKNKYGYSVLHCAAESGKVDVMAYILDRTNLDINQKYSINGCTPLHYAVIHRSLGVVKLLIERGADCRTRDEDGNTLLHAAAQYNCPDIVAYLIDEKNSYMNSKNYCGDTPLHNAAADNNIDSARVLIQRGADCLETNDDGETALHYAVQYKDPEMFSYFIETKEFDLNSRDKQGLTPLQVAAKNGCSDIVKCWLEKCHVASRYF